MFIGSSSRLASATLIVTLEPGSNLKKSSTFDNYEPFVLPPAALPPPPAAALRFAGVGVLRVVLVLEHA